MKAYISALALCFVLVACGGGGGKKTSNTISSNALSSVVAMNSSIASSANENTSISSATNTSATSSLVVSSASSANEISSVANSSSSLVVSSNSSANSSNTQSSSSNNSSVAMTCSDLEAISLLHATIDSSTHFSGYGELDLTLSTAADVETMLVCLKDLREHATDEDAIQSVEVTDQGNNQYQIQLSRYQLPVEYELSVYWGNPVSVARTTLAADEKSRVAFISTSQGTGDIASWTENPNDTPLEAADAVCTADANAAGLAGNYTAFLSIEDQVDAICRLRGKDSLFTNGANTCGLSQPLSSQQLSAPYLNLKGLPVAYGTKDIEQQSWRLPVGSGFLSTADGQQSLTVWTGSTKGGLDTQTNCEGWTTADTSARGSSGIASGQILKDDYTLTCDNEQPLICMSVGTGWPLAHTHEKTGHRVFVAPVTITENWSVQDADEACHSASGSNQFVAWMSDASDDALCRLMGDRGQAFDGCTNGTLNMSLGPWVRTDGYLIANDLQDLTSKKIVDNTSLIMIGAPILFNSDGSYSKTMSLGVRVRTDTSYDGTWSEYSCTSGIRDSIGQGWSISTTECGLGNAFDIYVYCFEK